MSEIMNKKNIILTSTDEVYGRHIKSVLGLVQGSTVQAKNIFRDIAAGLKGMIGGEIKSYTKLLADARDRATMEMVNAAKKLGADAIVGIRFSTSAIMPTAAEILVYGTAVKLK